MNFHEDFPILKNYTYLNTANSGMISNHLRNWRNQHDIDFMEGGSIFRANNLALMEQLRSTLSNTFSSDLNNTFLSSNFSAGFNALLNGLNNNHRFLLLEEDYPSVSYPITSRGFEFLEVPITKNLEEDILIAIEKFKPSVFAFSMVQYISGLRMQADFIKKIKAYYPDLLLIADGTQFTGTTVFNFKDSGLDALVGSGYKWLLGGYGNGYIFLSDKLRNLLYEYKKQSTLPKTPFLSGRDYLSLTLECGHFDSLNFGSLNQSIIYLNKLGLDFIERESQSIATIARKALNQKGLIADWMLERPEQSTIISIPLDKEIVQKLENAGVSCSARGTGTRISFHFYNTEDDINHLLEIID